MPDSRRSASSPRASTIDLVTADGVTLRGDLLVPEAPRAAMIICHPHPRYGGNRFDHVVEALFGGCGAAGIAALRFDFRSEFGGGVAEALDAAAAVARLREEVPDLPIVAAGYSFGAMVVLGLDSDRLAGKLLVAPPLTAMEVETAPTDPTLVLSPEHDQFTPASAAEPIVGGWDHADLVPIAMADHFLHGRTGEVVEVGLAWVDRIAS